MSHMNHQPTVATSHQHLWNMVREIIMMHGHACDLNHLDVSRVVDFSLLFESIPFEGDVSKWNMSNARDLSGMFEHSHFNGDVSAWDVSGVQDMSFMFANSPFNQSLANWNTGNVRNMRWMFRENSAFQQDISKWDTRRLQTTESMFAKSVFQGDLSAWDLGALTDAESMFEGQRLANVVPLNFYHWYSLLEDRDALSGHPDEDILVAHARAHYHVLAGLGMAPLQIAQQLQTLWAARLAPAPTAFDLPLLDR